MTGQERRGAMKEKDYYIYILRCEKNRLYTGYTDDMKRRFNAHCGGPGGARFTRSFRPLGIAQCWRAFAGRGDALKIEALIKKMSKEQKEELIRSPLELRGLIEADIGLDVVVMPCLDEVLAGSGQ